MPIHTHRQACRRGVRGFQGALAKWPAGAAFVASPSEALSGTPRSGQGGMGVGRRSDPSRPSWHPPPNHRRRPRTTLERGGNGWVYRATQPLPPPSHPLSRHSRSPRTTSERTSRISHLLSPEETHSKRVIAHPSLCQLLTRAKRFVLRRLSATYTASTLSILQSKKQTKQTKNTRGRISHLSTGLAGSVSRKKGVWLVSDN